jgi:S-adenosylmethionine synthetase
LREALSSKFSPLGTFSTDEVKQEIIARVVRPVVGDLLDKQTTITLNGTGKFLVSGPRGNTRLTCRKIIMDTYEAGPCMGVVRSAVKTPRKWTARRGIWQGMWRRTW